VSLAPTGIRNKMQNGTASLRLEKRGRPSRGLQRHCARAVSKRKPPVPPFTGPMNPGSLTWQQRSEERCEFIPAGARSKTQKAERPRHHTSEAVPAEALQRPMRSRARVPSAGHPAPPSIGLLARESPGSLPDSRRTFAKIARVSPTAIRGTVPS
jgi:hypothetical protein